MSTRTNILITYGQSRIYLYRHHDGYPANTGVDLVTKLRACEGSADKFLRALLSAQYDDGHKVYELTSEVHGDIEWAYAVEFNRTQSRAFPPKIGAAERGDTEDVDAAMARASQRVQSPADFARTVVNPEIKEQNKRLAELRKTHPPYRDAEDTPLLPEGDTA